MNKVLVTGAAGFIGRHCLPLLLAGGYDVHAVSSKAINRFEGIKWHQANLLDFGQVSELLAVVRPSHLLHLAWCTAPGKYWTSPDNLAWLQASLFLFQSFALQGGKRAVTAGTCAEYDWKYGYCSEQTTPLLPATLYGTCKHSLQMVLDTFSAQIRLSSAWGRIFFVYGPHEHNARLVPSTIRSLLRGEPANCSQGNRFRDFLYVEDVASAFVSLLQSKIQGPVNIASGQPTMLKDIVGRIAHKLERQYLLRFGTIPTPPNDPPLLVADTRRLHDEVGWKPEYDLDKGLEKTINWWKHALGANTGG